MAKNKKPLVDKNKDELQVAVADLRVEIESLRMDNAKRQLKNTTSMRTKRDELARLLTQMNAIKFIEKNSVKEEQK